MLRNITFFIYYVGPGKVGGLHLASGGTSVPLRLKKCEGNSIPLLTHFSPEPHPLSPMFTFSKPD